jgi:PAS domain S-box-containing protein
MFMSKTMSQADPTPPLDFRVLFESAPGLYLVLTPDLKIVAVSNEYLRATMTERQAILGRGIFEVFPDNPDDPTATGVRNLSDSLNRVLRNKVPDTMAVQKYDIRRPDSEGGDFEARYWSPVNSPVLGVGGKVEYIIHRVEDVTEFLQLTQQGVEREKQAREMRVRSEQMEAEVFLRGRQLQEANRQLREANDELGRIKAELERRVEQRTAELQREREQLRVTLGSIGDGVITTDAEGRVVFLNEVAEQLTCWGAREAQDLPLEEVFLIVNETTREQVENPAMRSLREGKIVGLANHTILIARDGSERPIDDSAAPIRDQQGTILGSVLVFRDISERKRAEQEVRASEVRKSAIVETALDCIITMDHAGKVVEFNPAAERTFGYSREQVIGRELADLIIPPSLRERHHRGLASYMATGEGPVLGKRLELPALRSDGSEFPVELAITRISAKGEPLFTAHLRDISDRTRAEQRRNARLGVTQALSEATNVQDGASGVLRAVCENLGWDLGFFWTTNEDGTLLRCVTSWRKPDAPVTGFETVSRTRTFAKGEGLPGRVWENGQPAWILDITQDSNFPRLAAAADHGFHSALACPVVIGAHTLGVIEFFTRLIREPDADLLELIGTTGGYIGQFIERRTAEDQVRRSAQELADFFENATVGLHWVGADGIIQRANRAELEMLGYSREEYIGRPIAEFHADHAVICDILKRLQDGEKLVEYPARLRCKDGSIKDVLIDSSVLFQGGEFVHTRCFTRDVSERRRAEAALRESEEKLRLLANTIPQLAWMARPDGHIFWYNRRWYEYTGTTPEEMEGWGWQSVHDAAQLPGVLERWKASIDTGEPFEMVFPLKGADQSFRSFLTRVNPLRDEEGHILYWFGTNTDITDQVQAERRVGESEQRFRQLADAMPQIVWTARPDGDIEYMNRQWHDFTGLPETLGNEGWGQILHPDEAGPAGERWAASVRSGAPFEMEMRLLDRRRHVYRWHLIRTVAVHDEAGSVVRWFGTSTDINDQKRAEESSRYLAEASAALASVVDYESTLQKVANLAVPYFADWSAVDMANGDGTLRRLAVAHQDADKIGLAHELMRDYPPDPQAPGGAFAVLRTGKSEIVAEITDDMLVQGAKDERHLRLIRSLGLRSYICVPLVVSGNPLGVLTFATAESGRTYADADLALADDLAHRAGVAIENTQLYQALRDADRRKDEFLATLAHELRNPLAPIRNALQILKMPRVDAATVERSRDMMERQVHHLVRLVDDLLDVSRVMRGKIELRREQVELATVVARAVETVQPLVDSQGHELNVLLPPDSLPINADPVRLAQVVGNLLTNAAKYTEPGGRIWLTAERNGMEAVLRVRDNGIGIAPEVLPRIFELFVQVDHAATRSQGGLGIGLTLVKNLCEMHNGSVEARSAGLGKGSEFIVRLPLSTSTVQRADGAAPGLASQSVSPSGHRLLVVDDNKDAADSLAMLLRLQGHEVRVAHSGPAALEMTKTYVPHAVFLDIGMPGMDGYEVARRMRQQPSLENVVLAALTGWGQQEDRRRTAEAGFNHHLVKPPEQQAVAGVLSELKRGPL